MLLQAHADLNPVSNQDASPLDLALRASQAVIVDILSRAGAKESRDIQVSSNLTDHKSENFLIAPRKHRSTSNTSSKVALTFDKPIQQGMLVGQFIYPSTLPNEEDWIFRISAPLGTMTTSLSIRLVQRRADMVEYPLNMKDYNFHYLMYEISRVTLDYQQLQLHGGSQGAFPGTI